jgi:transposase
MLAHLLVSKYCDHLPLYRQSEIYARDGVDLDRSTLSDWVGQAAWLLQPIVDGIRNHVFAADKIHADDTPVPVLDRPNPNRAIMGVCPRRPAVLWSRAAGSGLLLQPRPQRRAPSGPSRALHGVSAGRCL